MKINYKFSSDFEPTDEQLHALMMEVADEVRRRAQKSNEIFFKNLEHLTQVTLKLKTDNKTNN